jgi:hypothetical protein
MPITFPLSTLLVAGVSAAIALGTLAKAVMEYRLGNTLKRFEKYESMNRYYQSESSLAEVRLVLNLGEDAELESFDRAKKYVLMAFFEDVALMHQSGLMRMDVAGYLLGYDAGRVWARRKAFAANLYMGESDPNWALFWDFAERVGVDLAIPNRSVRSLRF